MWLLRREVSAEAGLLAMARAYRRDRGSGQAVPRLGQSRAAPRGDAGAPLPWSRTIWYRYEY